VKIDVTERFENKISPTQQTSLAYVIEHHEQHNGNGEWIYPNLEQCRVVVKRKPSSSMYASVYCLGDQSYSSTLLLEGEELTLLPLLPLQVI
jgi:hypothetical protein